ncbi:MAG: BON domain-containing protein [Thiohalocapsa sp.]
MGEYEDRYPEAYGREEPAITHEPISPVRPQDRVPGPQRFSLRSWFSGHPMAAPAAPAGWEHARRDCPAATEAAVAPPPRATGDYRGVGPRGYVRSPQRIYEDICDRLTDHPLIDASDIEVQITGVEVILAGSVDNRVTASRAEAVAREVSGVTSVRNALRVRDTRAAELMRRPQPVGGG